MMPEPERCHMLGSISEVKDFLLLGKERPAMD